MDNLKGKKLLILGGDSRSSDIVIYAKEAGVYTIVTDWYDTKVSPAKLIADEYWNDSIMDYDLLVKKIKENNINGIITGFTDSYLLPYQHLCELTGLPCYATKEIFEMTLDKAEFKNACRKYDIPVVPEYTVETIDKSSISPLNKIIIKPVDNSGSRGIVICDNPEKLEECLDYALSFSKKKKVVIEKFIDLDSLSMSYTLQDGEVSLSTVNDSYIHKAPGVGAATCGSIYPSKYTDFYIENIDPLFKVMFKEMGFKNGSLFVQGFTNGQEFYVIEMGYRLSGGRHYIWTEYENKSSSIKQLIHFALTGSMADYRIKDRDNANFKHLCGRVYVLGREAEIAKIEGVEAIKSRPEVVDMLMLKHVGDTIGKDGTSGQQIAIINFVVNDIQEFDSFVNYIGSTMKIYDFDGNNLVIDLLK